MAALRQGINAYYAATAIEVFTRKANNYLKAETLEKYPIAEIEKVTEGFTVYYTQPAADSVISDGLTLVSAKWNRDREAGRKWYKGTQEISNALQVLRSYSSYLRYLDDKENGLKRDLLRKFKNMTIDEQMKYFALMANGVK